MIAKEDAVSATLRPKHCLSSINFKKSNVIQTRHNDRNLPPSYLIGGNYEVNRTHEEALELKNQIIENAIEAYNANKPSKAPRFKAKSFEWSAVVNLKPDSTMADLEKLAEHLETKYGFQCYQIAIHRDEGYIDENGQKQINHHAHLEFITLDKNTGKSVFRAELQRPKALRQMQTEVAEILGMERGVDKRITKTKRIEPRQWAQMKESERAERKAKYTELTTQHAQEMDNARTHYKALKDENKALKAEILAQKDIKKEFMDLRKTMIEWGFCDKDDYRNLSQKLKEAQERAKNKEFTQADLDNAISKVKDELEKKHAQEITELKESLKNASKINENQKNELEALKKEKIDLNNDSERLSGNDILKGKKQAKSLEVAQILKPETIKHAEAVLRDRKYQIKINETPQFTSFKDEAKGFEALDYGLKIELKSTESANLQEQVKFMLDIAEAKGWALKDIKPHGSQEFVIEVQRQIINSLDKRYTNVKKKNKELEKQLKAKNKGYSRGY